MAEIKGCVAGNAQNRGAGLSCVPVSPKSLSMNPLAISNSRGFDGVVQGVTLLDLIQMECLAMTTRAVRVERGERHGRIFFTGGQIVHAEVDGLKGEPALFELLGWSGGTFIVEDGLRPLEDSINRDWHTLVMAAAHVSDELAAANTAAAPPQLSMSPIPLPPPPAAGALHDSDVQCAIHFTEDGAMLEAVGDIPEMFEASFAYVVQLLRHVGHALGAENLREIHVIGEQKKALCVLSDGKIAAVVGSAKLNLPALAQKLS